MRRLLVAAATVVLGTAACRKQEPLPSQMASPAAFRDPEEARSVALAPPPSGSALSAEISAVEQRVLHSPGKLDGWIALGKDWVRLARRSGDPGFYLNAAACAELALQSNPEAAPALELRALALLNEHRFAQARDVATHIVSLHGDDTQALGALSDAELELGHFEAAANAAQRMVDVKPNLPSYSRTSYLRWLQGDVAGSKEVVRHAIDSGWAQHDVEPLAWVFVQAAMIFWNEGDYLGADTGFDQALALVPDYAPALVGKARVALAAEDGQRAAQLLAQANGQTPLVETQALLADALELQGDLRGAGEARAAAIRDGRQRDRLTAATVLAAQGEQPEQALSLIEAERRDRGGPYVEDTYAWALYRLGRTDEARAASERATRLGTQDARLLFHAGAIRLAQRDAAGLELVQRALTLNPAFDVHGAAEARQLLARTDALGSAK